MNGMNPREILEAAHTILVIDWPSRDVPESLARAGFEVVVQGGPGPEDYSVYEIMNGEIVVRRSGRLPERADLIYAYRPLSELPSIVAMAQKIGAKTIWLQSGFSPVGAKDPAGCWLRDEDSRNAQKLLEAAGINFVSQPFIAEVARQLRATA